MFKVNMFKISMKKVIGIIAVVAIVIIAISASNKETTETVETVETLEVKTVQEVRNDIQETASFQENADLKNNEYIVISTASTLGWKGSSPIRSHSGTIDIANGSLVIEDNSVIGDVVLNMNSIQSGAGGGLDGHLKSDDFFNIIQYPTARILINGYSNNNLDIDLTIKGTTLNILVPATLIQEETMVRILGATEIDRALWDIRYNSNSFFANLGDSAINDQLEINFDLVAEEVTNG